LTNNKVSGGQIILALFSASLAAGCNVCKYWTTIIDVAIATYENGLRLILVATLCVLSLAVIVDRVLSDDYLFAVAVVVFLIFSVMLMQAMYFVGVKYLSHQLRKETGEVYNDKCPYCDYDLRATPTNICP